MHVKPRASKSRVLGERAGELDVAVAAPPVDGEANAELRRTLARHFGLSQSKVAVVSGESSRHKLVRLYGLTLDAARARLTELAS